jgi:hypothetical protein
MGSTTTGRMKRLIRCQYDSFGSSLRRASMRKRMIFSSRPVSGFRCMCAWIRRLRRPPPPSPWKLRRRFERCDGCDGDVRQGRTQDRGQLVAGFQQWNTLVHDPCGGGRCEEFGGEGPADASAEHDAKEDDADRGNVPARSFDCVPTSASRSCLVGATFAGKVEFAEAASIIIGVGLRAGWVREGPCLRLRGNGRR